jgi:two-component system, NarL family, response regulator LiaR
MSHTKPIRVLIVDDHAMVRSGLRLFLLAFDDLEFAGETNNGREAVAMVEQLQPDVVLMDLMMPGMDGIFATREIKNRFPDVKTIALTSFPDPALMSDALQAGAISYILKSVTAAELANAIRAAQAGSPTFSPEMTRALIHSSNNPPLPVIELTNRERDVLTLIGKGKSNVQIAAELSISLSTTKFHVSAVLSKLGVKNRSEAITRALQYHLIDSGGYRKA